MFYSPERWYQALALRISLPPEEELYYRLQHNPVWPFIKVAPGVYHLCCRSDRLNYSLWILALSTITYTVLIILVGNVSIIHAMFIVSAIFCIWGAFGNFFWKELILCRMKGKGFFVCRLFRTQEVVMQGDIRNIYIKLEERDAGSGDVYYFLSLGGYHLNDHRISRMSRKKKYLKIMGNLIARRVGINFFDCNDISDEHAVRFYPPQSVLQFNEEMKVMYKRKAWKASKRRASVGVKFLEKDWMKKKKVIWLAYQPEWMSRRETIQKSAIYHYKHDRHEEDNPFALALWSLSSKKNTVPRTMWVYKRVGNKWQKMKFYVKLQNWEKVYSSEDETDAELKQKKEEDQEEDQNMRKKDEIVLHKLKWNREKLLMGKKWLRDLSYNLSPSPGAIEYEQITRKKMQSFINRSHKWTNIVHRRFGIKVPKGHLLVKYTLPDMYEDDDSEQDVISLSPDESSRAKEVSKKVSPVKQTEVKIIAPQKEGMKRPSLEPKSSVPIITVTSASTKKQNKDDRLP